MVYGYASLMPGPAIDRGIQGLVGQANRNQPSAASSLSNSNVESVLRLSQNQFWGRTGDTFSKDGLPKRFTQAQGLQNQPRRPGSRAPHSNTVASPPNSILKRQPTTDLSANPVKPEHKWNITFSATNVPVTGTPPVNFNGKRPQTRAPNTWRRPDFI